MNAPLGLIARPRDKTGFVNLHEERDKWGGGLNAKSNNGLLQLAQREAPERF